MSRLPLVAATVLLLLLAGCLGTADDLGTTTEETQDRPAIVPGKDVEPIRGDPLPSDAPPHDHTDASQHDVAVNMELIAKPDVPASSETHHWNGNIPLGLNIRFGEMDVQGDVLAQCSRDGDGAYLWDITNRSDPQIAGRLTGQGSCPDIKLTKDAQYAIIGGNKLYDIRDIHDPVQVLEAEDAGTPGCHMCSITEIDGEEYVVLSGRSDNIGNDGFDVVRFTRDPASMELVSSWRKSLTEDSLGTLAEQDIANTVHDQYVYHDKLLNKTLVVPAMWDYGIYVVDISDPTAPKDLGHWGDYRGESGNIHTTAVDFIEVDGEERRIIIGATETGAIIGGLSATEPGYIYIFDATDLDDIQLLGKWANPGMRSTGYDTQFFPVGEYSAHNVQFVDGLVYMAHYHAGVWVIDVGSWVKENPDAKGDLRSPLPDDIPNMGVYLTHDADVGTAGAIWDVVVKDGHIYASDYALGLFVLHYAGDDLNDPAETSDA